jgi:N-acetylglutamate synthase-like GNAT family acetyltransferase
MSVLQPVFSDIPQIAGLVNSDPKHLVPRTEVEIAMQLQYWRIIKVAEEVVACGCFDFFSPRIAEIRSIIVSPDHRGKGYADDIMQALLALAYPGQQVFVVTAAPDFFRKYDFGECLGEKYILYYKNLAKS